VDKPTFARGSIEYDFDLDLHAIWRESSGIPPPPSCLATDTKHSGLASPSSPVPAGDGAEDCALV
jgi:hypothetical protein